jgi:hypothetical protein
MKENPHTSLTATSKTDFSSVYNQPDPRAYFAALQPFSYQTPQNASSLISHLVNASDCGHGSKRLILDVCCSYGINAALLRCNLTYDGLTHHYAESKLAPSAQVAADRVFFDARTCSPQINVLGLDIATNAIRYATSTGLITNGWDEDLEENDPSPELRDSLRNVGLVICTGGFAYVAGSTFPRIAASVAEPQNLWVMVSVLRTFSFDEMARALGSHGLVTEKIPGATFRQRRFTSPEEKSAAIADVIARGLNPSGLEADGWFYTECYLSRSTAEVARVPIEKLARSFA